jgi:hypothetical protein
VQLPRSSKAGPPIIDGWCNPLTHWQDGSVFVFKVRFFSVAVTLNLSAMCAGTALPALLLFDESGCCP